MLLMLARLRRFMEFDQLLSRMDKEGVARSSVTYCNIMTKCKETRDAGWMYDSVSFLITQKMRLATGIGSYTSEIKHPRPDI